MTGKWIAPTIASLLLTKLQCHCYNNIFFWKLKRKNYKEQALILNLFTKNQIGFSYFSFIHFFFFFFLKDSYSSHYFMIFFSYIIIANEQKEKKRKEKKSIHSKGIWWYGCVACITCITQCIHYIIQCKLFNDTIFESYQNPSISRWIKLLSCIVWY